MSEAVFQAAINYWSRLGCWRHVQAEVKLGLKKLGNDPVMHLWNSFSMVNDDKVAEGMRELDKLAANPDVGLAVTLALLQAHKLAAVVDKDAVKDLENRMKMQIKDANDKALLQGALIMWHIDKADKARDLVDKLMKSKETDDALSLRGWIDLTSGRDVHAQKSLKYLDEALKKNPQHLEALMGKAKYLFDIKQDFKAALATVQSALAHYSNYVPALIEKSKIELACSAWDEAIDSADRCMAQALDCAPAYHTKALAVLAKSGNYQEGAQILNMMLNALDKREPRNHQLYYELSQGPARVGGRTTAVLQMTRTLLERALTITEAHAAYFNEQALQTLRRDHLADAGRLYKRALEVEATSVDAINGTVHCQLLDSKLEEAEQQLSFLAEISASIGKTPTLCYLRALLAAKKNEPPSAVLQLLDEAVKLHVDALHQGGPSREFFIKLDPDFMIDMAKLYLQYTPSDPPKPGDAASPELPKICRLLEVLTKHVPGCIEAVYLLARAKFLSGLTSAAQSGAQYCLRMDNTYADAHLLMAELHLAQQNLSSASQSLQSGLSFNFEVREAPLYHVIQARIHLAEGKPKESVKALLAAMKLPGVKKAVQQVSGTAKKKAKKPMPLGDRVTVFLELASAYTLVDQASEAAKVLADATQEFAGTPEEVRVLMAHADLAVERADVEGAIATLRGVKPGMPYYIQAKERMARIYLQQRKDKRMYAACYQELLEQSPSGHTHLLLGDAYMNIQEPAKAIATYENALKANPRDGVLASKIGAALVKTHDYSKAINYYEAAVRSGELPMLRQDLARLYLKLRQYDKADKVLTVALSHPDVDDLQTWMQDVSYLRMQAEVHTAAQKPDMAIGSLIRAKEVQSRVLSRVTSEQPEALKEQQELASGICMKMAKHYETVERDANRAVQAYQEALALDREGSEPAMIALAKVFLKRGDLEAAQFQLNTVLARKTGPAGVQGEAALMMADIMFRKYEYDSATFHLQQLLEREAGNYQGLARMVDLMRRAGKLDGCLKFIKRAEETSLRPDSDAGLNYCQGLYDRLTMKPNEALRHFNKARKDSDWGVAALYQMVEICLNPDNQTLGAENISSPDSEALQMGVQTAEKLLQELSANGEGKNTKYKLLKNYALLAQKSKMAMEKALQNFTVLAQEENEHIGTILGMARAFQLLKNTPKARNQLKRVHKEEWNSDDAEDFEGAWLLLADIHISGGKYDLAQELLKRVLQHNKSCSKAWEFMGFIMEKEQSYGNAAEFYENAWSSASEGDPAVGFKLAFNYLKASRFVDAVDICHKVLSRYPEYPKIRKEILDKARMSLRA